MLSMRDRTQDNDIFVLVGWDTIHHEASADALV